MGEGAERGEVEEEGGGGGGDGDEAGFLGGCKKERGVLW